MWATVMPGCGGPHGGGTSRHGREGKWTYNAAGGGAGLLLLLEGIAAVLGLEVLDQGINVFILFLVVFSLGLGRRRVGGALLLLEFARLDIGVQRRGVGRVGLGHGDGRVQLPAELKAVIRCSRYT